MRFLHSLPSMRGHPVTDLRTRILSFHDSNPEWSSSKIANFLQNSSNPPTQNLQALLKFIHPTISRNTIQDLPRSGRPSKQSKKVISILKRYVKNKRHRSIRNATRHLQQQGFSISHATVYRTLKKRLKYRPFSRHKAQKMTPLHRANRKIFSTYLLQKFGGKRSRRTLSWKNLLVTGFFWQMVN